VDAWAERIVVEAAPYGRPMRPAAVDVRTMVDAWAEHITVEAAPSSRPMRPAAAVLVAVADRCCPPPPR
jgi:hypothetical protein